MDQDSISIDSGTWLFLMILVVAHCAGAVFRGAAAKPRSFDGATRFLTTAIALKATMQLLAFVVPMLDSRGAISAFTLIWTVTDFVVIIFALLSMRSFLFSFVHPNNPPTPPAA